MQTWMSHSVHEHIGSKILPSAGLQLNTVPPCQAWLSPALREEIYMENYSWWRENKREESGSAWFQPLLADDARVNWWRETQGGAGSCSPTGPPWWDAPESKQHMVPPWASTHILHVQQHSRLRDTHTHTPLIQQIHTLLDTQNVHTLLPFIHSQTQKEYT